MTPRHGSKWLAQLVSNRAPRVPDSAALERSVETVARALRARRARLQRRRWLWRGSVAACAAALFGFTVYGNLSGSREQGPHEVRLYASASGSGAWLGTAGAGGALQPFAELEQGARVSTAQGGGAQLVYSTGTQLALGPSSEVLVLARGALQHLALLSGSLQANVAKLQAGQRFVVDLPGAQVEVRGTVFELHLLDTCSGELRAMLSVTEGTVEVRSAHQAILVQAGGTWKQACSGPVSAYADAPDVAAQSPTTPHVVEPAEPATSGSGGRAQSGAAEQRRASSASHSLAEQNELFSAAVGQQRRGDAQAALATYALFLQRFPRSALAENALLARVRLLSLQSSDAARREGRRFLQRFPHSAARSEVQELVGQR